MNNDEIQLTLEDRENMELYQLIAKSIDFLNEKNNDAGKDYLSVAIAEGTIPKTRPHIKKFVLESYKGILKNNSSIMKINSPLYKVMYRNLNYELIQPLLYYFEDERKCLYTLRDFLDCKANFPIASFGGVLTSTIIDIHNVNIDKLNDIIEVSNNAKHSAFSIDLPDSYLAPYKQDFINEMETTVNKFLIKRK